jgi:hypothetical protein
MLAIALLTKATSGLQVDVLHAACFATCNETPLKIIQWVAQSHALKVARTNT